MIRLPCGDRTTGKSELAVFAGLGLAAVMMVSLALVQTAKFMARSDRIAAAISERQQSLANSVPTNEHNYICRNMPAWSENFAASPGWYLPEERAQAELRTLEAAIRYLLEPEPNNIVFASTNGANTPKPS